MNPAGDQFSPAGAAPAGGGHSVRRQAWWGGLLLVAALAAVGGGASGVASAVGLILLVVGLIAVVRGRVTWAYLHTRTRGGAALGAAMTLLAIGGATADPAPTAGGAPPAVSSPSSLAAVSELPVKGRSAKTGYSRASFGPVWFDADRNGCDTRNDILRRDLVDRIMKNPCKVLAGTAAPDPYTGTQIRFISGGADEIDVDHVVSVAATKQSPCSRSPAHERHAVDSRSRCGRGTVDRGVA